MSVIERFLSIARRIFAPLLVAALGGCALAPAYHPPTTAMPDSYKEDGPWRTASPQDELPHGPWWLNYGDTTLTSLESRLEEHSPDIGIAAARYSEARALAAEADAGRYPTAAAGAVVNHDRQSDNRPLRSASQPAEYRNYAVGGALTYEVDLWGRVRDLVAVGRASALASAADLDAVRLSLHAELAVDYLNLRGLDSELALLTDTEVAYQRALELTQSRHSGGAASGLDVARAETQADSTAAQITDTTARRALIEHAIARLVGESPARFSLPASGKLAAVPEVPIGVPSTLVERRPDIAAAERRVAAANAAIGVARAAYFPRITLSATGGFESTGAADWLTAPNRYWSIGPQALLTVFDAGVHRAEVNRAKSVLSESSERYRATVLSAFQEVEDYLALLSLTKKEFDQQAQASQAAQRALDLANNRYSNGAVDYLEVVISQTAALQARRAMLALQARQLVASVGLIRSLGGGWTVANLDPAATSRHGTRAPESTGRAPEASPPPASSAEP
jgi:NodT family efflux transporter outer membrane factor (OMF) lipoprotein